MGMELTATTNLQCTMGVAPAPLMVLPVNLVMVGMPAGNIMDYVPMMNIMPFGMCNSMANPMVIAATAAALGVMTPMPCIPMTAAPWIPGSPTVLIGNMPALSDSCMCMCSWGGVVKPVAPAQFTTMVA